MEIPVQGITAPAGVYEIAGRRFEIGSRGFAEAIADAHASHQRPRCLCQAEGVEMYVAHLGKGYIVKRMPDTGSHHAPDCPSYEPPAEFSGLGQVLGSAIIEDPATGETTLKLDFPLSKMPGRSWTPSAGGKIDSVASDGTKLSLRGLLHYLWDQAELTRWHPGFAGKRSWATVRRHLLSATQHMLTKGNPLGPRLYVPEPFSIEARDAINARRLKQWQQTIGVSGKTQQLALLIGEMKEIAPARYGYRAIVKHLPDQSFAVDEQLYRRLGRSFERELGFWAATDRLRMVLIGTFALGSVGIPTLFELSLMPVTQQWIPVEDAFSLHLVDHLVAGGRSFTKSLSYNLTAADCISCAILTDCEGPPIALHIRRAALDRQDVSVDPTYQEGQHWEWCGNMEPMPALPARASERSAA